jgi:NAD(P)-dependent dehydrogenase (short-subunit alcohol dehydrogenase family)
MTNPVYAASKVGLDGMTRSLAAALGQYDINVNAVAPGLTSSPMGRALGDDAALQAAVEDGPLANLLRRVSTPDDVAQVIAWLCTPAARQLTGQTIHTSAGNVV